MANKISNSIAGLANTFNKIGDDLEAKERREEVKRKEDDLIDRRNKDAENRIQLADASAGLTEKIETGYTQFDAKLEEQRFEGLLAGEEGKSSFDSIDFLKNYESDIMDPFESNFDIEQTDYNQDQVAQARAAYTKTRQNVRSQLRAKYAENQTKHINKRFTARSAVLLDVLDGKVDSGEDPVAAYNTYVAGITELQKIVGEPIVIGQSADGELITHSPFLGETAIQMSLRFNGARQTVSSLVSAGKFEQSQDFYEGLTTGTEGSSVKDFIEKLTGSESGGRSDASYTNEEGDSYVGLIQFGEDRLTDFRNATNTEFTQEEFRNDVDLQDEAGIWHIKDIDKRIASQKAKNPDLFRRYNNLDGLRAVAHLSGMGKNFVSFLKGKGNVKDALGTSQQDYYNLYANGAKQGTSSLHGVNKQGVSYRKLLRDSFEEEMKAEIKNITEGVGASESQVLLLTEEHDIDPTNEENFAKLRQYIESRKAVVEQALEFDSDNPQMNILDPQQKFALERHVYDLVTGKVQASTNRVSPASAAAVMAKTPVGSRAPKLSQLIAQQGSGEIPEAILTPVIGMLESPLVSDPRIKAKQIQDRRNMVTLLNKHAKDGRIPTSLQFSIGTNFARFLARNPNISDDDILKFASSTIDDKIKYEQPFVDEDGVVERTSIDIGALANVIQGGGIFNKLEEGFIEPGTTSEKINLTTAIRVKQDSGRNMSDSIADVNASVQIQRNANVPVRPNFVRAKTEDEARLYEVGLVNLVANAAGKTFNTQKEFIEFAQSFVAIPRDPYDPNDNEYRIVTRGTNRPMLDNQYIDVSEVYALRNKGIASIDQLMDSKIQVMDDVSEEIGIRDVASRWDGGKDTEWFYRTFSDAFDFENVDQLGALGAFDSNGDRFSEANLYNQTNINASGNPNQTILNVLTNSENVLEAMKKSDPATYKDIVRLRENLKRFGSLSHIQIFPDYMEEISAAMLTRLYIRASLVDDNKVGKLELTPRDIQSIDLVDSLPSGERERLEAQGRKNGLAVAFSKLYPEAAAADKAVPGTAFVKSMMEMANSGASLFAGLSRYNTTAVNAIALGQPMPDLKNNRQKTLDSSYDKPIAMGSARLNSKRFLSIRESTVDGFIEAAVKNSSENEPLIISSENVSPNDSTNAAGDLANNLIGRAVNGNLQGGTSFQILDNAGASLSIESRVVDGDTVSITSSNGEQVIIHNHMPEDTLSLNELTPITLKLPEETAVRVVGQNAPEVKKAWRGEPGEEGGNESYVFMVESTKGKQVYVQVFPTVDGRDLMKDNYNRVLGGLSVDGEDLTASSLKAGLTKTLFMSGFGIEFGVEQAEEYALAAQQGNDFALGLYSEKSPTVERKAYSHLEQQALENKKGKNSPPFQPLFLSVPDGNGAGFLIGNSYPDLGIPEVDLNNAKHTETLIQHFRKLSKKREFLPFSDEASANSFIAESAKYIFDSNVSPVYKSVRAGMREHTNRVYVQNETDMLIEEFPNYTGIQIAQAVRKSSYGRSRNYFHVDDLRRILESESLGYIPMFTNGEN